MSIVLKIKITRGARLGEIRKTSASHFQEVKGLSKSEIIKLCNELLALEVYEYRVVAFDWFYRIRKQYVEADFKIFEFWVLNHLTDWMDCDDLCTHALGEFLIRYPNKLPKVFAWSKSTNWVVRRAAAVALILPVKSGLYFSEVLKTSTQLLQDEHDLVRKGCGWALKESCRHFQKEVFEFVMLHKDQMPRVSLRYAIEKMPQTLKKKAMK